MKQEIKGAKGTGGLGRLASLARLRLPEAAAAMLQKTNWIFPGQTLVILLLLCWFPVTLCAEPLDHWTWRNPLPKGNVMNSVAYGNGTFVSVGELGTITVSKDSVSWTNVESATFDNVNAVAYGNGLFVALFSASGDPERILTSSNAIAWTSHSYPGVNNLVAVGDCGALLASTNGSDWTPRNSGTSAALYGATERNGTFVVVGAEGTILTSTDGVTWASGGSGITTEDLLGVAFGNGLYVVVGVAGTILSSPDAINWTAQDSGTTDPVTRITYGAGLFVALSSSLFFDAFSIMTSADAIHWTSQIRAETFGIPFPSGVAYGSGEFVITVSVLSPLGEGTGGRLLHSNNAVDWTESALGGSAGLNGVAYGSGTFVAAGNGGGLFGCAGASPWSSRDRIAWADRSLDAVPRNLRCVAYGNGTFVAGGNYGTILQSDKFGPRLAPFARLANGPFTRIDDLIGAGGADEIGRP
jgi:hypothetical protein